MLLIPFKRQKRATIVNAFQNILDSSKEKETKYGLIKAVNFITILLENG